MTERSLAELLRDLHHRSTAGRTQAARSLDTLLRRWGRNLGDDVVQTVWMKLLKKPELPAKLATMTSDKQEAYLRAMLRNTHRDLLKQEQKEKRRFWQPKNEDEKSLADVLEQYPAEEADLLHRSLSEQGDAVLRHGLALLAGVKPALALTTLGVDPSVQRSLDLFCGRLVPALADTYRFPAHREAFLGTVIDQWSLNMSEVTREGLWERDREQSKDSSPPSTSCPSSSRVPAFHSRLKMTSPVPSTSKPAATTTPLVHPRFCQCSHLGWLLRPSRSSFSVSSASSPSAKLDLPEPLRPMTRVRPGPAGSSSRHFSPMPRNPCTSIQRKCTAPRGSSCPPCECSDVPALVIAALMIAFTLSESVLYSSSVRSSSFGLLVGMSIPPFDGRPFIVEFEGLG